jgi:hypothetical protein
MITTERDFMHLTDNKLSWLGWMYWKNDRSSRMPLLRFVVAVILVSLVGLGLALYGRSTQADKLPELFDWPVSVDLFSNVSERGRDNTVLVTTCRAIMAHAESACMHPSSYDDTPRNVLVAADAVYINPTRIRHLEAPVLVMYQSLNAGGGTRLSLFSAAIELFYDQDLAVLILDSNLAYCIQSYGFPTMGT